MEFLTSSEAADYLRLKERKLYELVANGAIPCTKVTGRWLFPRVELDRWILHTLAHPKGFPPVEPAPIIGGSHDPLLEWALRESGSALATLPEGSERGLKRFADGEVVAAAIHLHALERDDPDANVKAVQDHPKARESVLIAFARREQGLVVTPDNPLALASIGDVVAKHARLALRPQGAGAQLLLLALLHRAKASLEKLAPGPTCPTGTDIAQVIRSGHADCGIATRSVANAAGLGFVPILWENFDLVMRQCDYFRPPLQALFGFIRTGGLLARALDAGGYDVSIAGKVRYAP